MFRRYGLPLMAVGMLLFAVYHVVRAQQEPGKLDPPVAPARSPFGNGVAGAGLVEAQTENILVGSNLPGIVTQVFVQVGQKVKKDDPLFKVDDRALQAEHRVRQAALDSARAHLQRLQQMPRKEELPALQTKLDEARANLADQHDQYHRARRLYATRAISEEERSRREQANQMAREQARKAEADLELLKAGAWKPDLSVAEAAVELTRATLEQTKTELERLEVRAL